MKQRNKMRIRDMTYEYWIYFKENYLQKGFRKWEKQDKKWWKTSNDGDASTKSDLYLDAECLLVLLD